MNTSAIDNKFKFITVAAARCHQLQHGARPRVESKSRKPVTIAQEEVRTGLIDFRVPEEVREGPATALVESIPEGEDVG